MEMTSAVAALSAFGQNSRLATVRLLIKAGPEGIAAGDVAESLQMPPSSLSTHLMLLANAGRASSRRDGRSIIYRAD